MQKTFKELNQIDLIVGELYKKTPTLKDSKFGYAYKRFSDINYLPTLKKFKIECADLAVKHALEDKITKELLKDDKGNYKYSREGQSNYDKEYRAIDEKFGTELVDVTPYISETIPDGLSIYETEILTGLLIEEKKKK